MILEGNLRGGARNLALHLQKDENDHVEVHELRGFVADDLEPALKEIHAISRGTRAKKYMYSLSFNPPPDEAVGTGTFREAIERAESTLGLRDQPRAIVFHTKEARRHCHVVWSVIDAQEMKAIPMSHDRYKLMNLSRELYQENGWKMPKGFIRGQSPDPKNFTHGEWMQFKRTGISPEVSKTTIRDCWGASDTQASFEAALKEKGYFLAKGRRGPVVIDTHCETHSVARAVGVRVKNIRARVKENSLRDAQEQKAKVATMMEKRLSDLQKQREQAIDKRLSRLQEEREKLRASQCSERAKQEQLHKERSEKEQIERQQRFSKGLRAVLEFFSGKRKEIKLQNEREAAQAKIRDQEEKDKLIQTQLEKSRKLKTRQARIDEFNKQRRDVFKSDLEQLRKVKTGEIESLKKSQSLRHKNLRLDH